MRDRRAAAGSEKNRFRKAVVKTAPKRALAMIGRARMWPQMAPQPAPEAAIRKARKSRHWTQRALPTPLPHLAPRRRPLLPRTLFPPPPPRRPLAKRMKC